MAEENSIVINAATSFAQVSTQLISINVIAQPFSRDFTIWVYVLQSIILMKMVTEIRT